MADFQQGFELCTELSRTVIYFQKSKEIGIHQHNLIPIIIENFKKVELLDEDLAKSTIRSS
jgi:hypothetical protein